MDHLIYIYNNNQRDRAMNHPMYNIILVSAQLAENKRKVEKTKRGVAK